MSRSQMCTKRPAPGQGVLIHCDHNGKCCWCGETKEPEHGPYAPVEFGLIGQKDWPSQSYPTWQVFPYQNLPSPSVAIPFGPNPNVIYCGNDPHKQNTCGGL